MIENKTEFDPSLLNAIISLQFIDIITVLKNKEGFGDITTSTEQALKEFYFMGFKSGINYACALQGESMPEK